MHAALTRSLLALAAFALAACEGFPSPDDFFAVPPDAGPPPAAPPTGAQVPPPRAQSADAPPPPISGGTLAVTDRQIIIADPDRDRVLVVDRYVRDIVAEIRDVPEPGRVLVDRDGWAHVLLRGSGELLSFHPASAWESTRMEVCGGPRGLVDGPTGLVVACASGGLFAVDPVAGTRHLLGRPAGDLRDLARVGDRLFASRFRAAEILELDWEGRLARRVQIAVPGGSDGARSAVAWRMIATETGHLAVAHQIAHPERPFNQPPQQPYYGGGPTPCSTMVLGAVSLIDPDDDAPAAQPVEGLVLPVDLAIGPGGDVVVAAAGGVADQSARVLQRQAPGACHTAGGLPVPASRYTAVQRTESGYAFLARDPAALVVVDDDGSQWSLPLAGRGVYDTSHALYHDATGAGLACASCHPEGEDDGVTWHFKVEGRVRTPTLRGGLVAPFHWRGELPDLRALMNEVMTGRMQGPRLDADAVSRFADWVDSMPAFEADVLDAEAAERGAGVFARAGCTGCHLNGSDADGLSHDVGTGGSFQTPALRGVAQRFPLMHDGCAATFADRFRPACGGENHGATADLTPPQRADLVAYLRSL